MATFPRECTNPDDAWELALASMMTGIDEMGSAIYHLIDMPDVPGRELFVASFWRNHARLIGMLYQLEYQMRQSGHLVVADKIHTLIVPLIERDVMDAKVLRDLTRVLAVLAPKLDTLRLEEVIDRLNGADDTSS